MAKKNHPPAPVPPGNQPQSGPPDVEQDDQVPGTTSHGPGDQEQDPKRRLGDYMGKGEHSIQQPGGKGDANHHGGRKGDK